MLDRDKEETAPDDGLLNGVVKRHEELRVLPDAAHKVPDKHIEAVRRGRLDASRDAAVVGLDVGLQAGERSRGRQ